MSQMTHESSYESVSGFSQEVRIRIRVGVGFSVRVGVSGSLFLRREIENPSAFIKWETDARTEAKRNGARG